MRSSSSPTAARLLFLRNEGDENQIDLRTEAHDEREDAKDHEIKSDAPGTTAARLGFGRPAFDETDFHQQEEDRWAKDAAEELKNARWRMISRRWRSSPRRDAGRACARSCTRRSSGGSSSPPKEMTDRPIPDIEDLLVGESAPPA